MAFSVRQMDLILATLLGVVALLLSQAGTWGQPYDSLQKVRLASAPGKQHAAGRLIITYRPGISGMAKNEAVSKIRGQVVEKLGALNAEVISVPQIQKDLAGTTRDADLRRIKAVLKKQPAVASVDYDYVRKADFIPNDPDFKPYQWDFQKTGFTRAWDTVRGRDIKVAVVDTGVDANHPDLKGKVIAQHDFIHNDGVANDTAGHGTHVAGTIAASTNNGVGVAGGCPRCRLLAARVLTKNGGYDSDIARGIVWSANNGARVINLSLGGSAYSTALKRAVDYAYNKGAVVVAAAGNTGNGTYHYPAAYPDVIAVAATNSSDRRASFSTYGNWVDIAAPGVDILSTYPRGLETNFYEPGCELMEGTSMASPHVAALAALLAVQDRSKSEIRFRILSTADNIGPEGRDRYTGAGLIDAARAVEGPNSGGWRP